MDDDITSNSANKETKIDIKMVKIISEEVDLFEAACEPVQVDIKMVKVILEEVDLLEIKCEPVQMEESDSEQSDTNYCDTSSI